MRQETERRLKDILAGKKAPSGAVVAAPAAPVGKKKSVAARQQQSQQIFQVRLWPGLRTWRALRFGSSPSPRCIPPRPNPFKH